MNKEKFYILLPFFESSYLDIYKKTIATKQQQEKRIQFPIKIEEKILFFTLELFHNIKQLVIKIEVPQPSTYTKNIII